MPPPSRLRWIVGRCSRALAVAASVATLACAGGAPLLYPAHPLPAGAVTVGAGTSQRFALGEADGAIDAAATAARDGVATEETPTVIRGAVAQTTAAPGLAPWIGARGGLGRGYELGLVSSGRTLRADGRHAFAADSTALSLGLGVSSQLGAPGDELGVAGAIDDVEARGLVSLAVEVPVLVGYRSSANVVSLWAGLRPGLEAMRLELELGSVDGVARETTVHARRLWVDGVLGAMVGVRPLWVAVELDVGRTWGSGRWDPLAPASGGAAAAALEGGESDPIGAFTLTPAAVLVGRFD